MSLIELKQKLKQQVGFLERSARLYDDGYKEEAIRIAATFRVCFHDTTKSHSLFKQMAIKNRINLISTVDHTYRQEPRKGLVCSSALCGFGGTFGGAEEHTLGYTPNCFGHFKENMKHESVTVEKWWNEVIYSIHGEVISRKDIILNAANKDGGAHIDLNLPRDYQELCGGYFFVTNNPDGTSSVGLDVGGALEPNTRRIPNSHFADLRQMAYEVLSSEDFLSAAL